MGFLSVAGQLKKTSPGNVLKYSPDQDRDDAGRFGSGGGGGGVMRKTEMAESRTGAACRLRPSVWR